MKERTKELLSVECRFNRAASTPNGQSLFASFSSEKEESSSKFISALAAVIVAAGTIYLTKQKEREASWRAKKLAYYEEFLGSASGIVGDNTPPDAKIRFATAVNNLHLIGSTNVIKALHAFTDEIALSNRPRMTMERHDRLWSQLVWHIRSDLGDAPGEMTSFKARSQLR